MQTRYAAKQSGNSADTWLRINELLATRRHEILERENANGQHIYLYDMGAYRAAFEQSAWQLCRLFPHSTTAVIESDVYPFTIVTAFVSNNDVQQYVQNHIVESFDKEYTMIAGTALPPSRYERWHKDIADDLKL